MLERGRPALHYPKSSSRYLAAYLDRLHGMASKKKVMIVFGSGGHTSEMLSFIKRFPSEQYGPFFLVVATTDMHSQCQVEQENLVFSDDVAWFTVNRAREVKQSFLPSIISSLICSSQSIILLLKLKPDLLMVNGPGTCVPLCLIARFLNWLGFLSASIIFIESFCRVNSLSISGRIVYFICDKLVVQWQNLRRKYPRAEYIGSIY